MSAQEGVGGALAADGGRGAMAAQHDRLIRKREQLPANARDQGVVVPAGEVGAADRAGEEGITGKDDSSPTRLTLSGGMAGRVAHREPVAGDHDGVPGRQRVMRRRRRRQPEAEPEALLGEGVVEGAIPRVKPDGRPGGGVHLGHADDVVEMGVGEPDGPRRQRRRSSLGEESLGRLLPGIDDRRLPVASLPDR